MLNLHAGIKRCHRNSIQKKVTITCPFVANEFFVYISLKATTVVELLEFYSTNNRKIKSLFGKFHPTIYPTHQ